MIVNVVDAGCGVGKTTSIINMINDDNSNERYLYITPFLTEVTRIINSCPNKKFKEPQDNGQDNKLDDIKKLFNKRENIASTHALFKKMDEEILDITSVNDYTLVMDEVADVIDVLNISKDDLKTIMNQYAIIKEDGILEWTAKEYEGKFEEYKNMIEMNSVMIHNDYDNNPIALIWLFPIEIFKAFKKIYILTYMFDGQIQKYYYDMYKVKYKYWYIKDMKLTEEKIIYNLNEYKSLIKICNKERMNRIGDSQYALSAAWLERNKNNILMDELKNNTYNFFRNMAKTKSKDNLWTTIKSSRDYLKGKSYGSGFLSITIRATNEYKNKKSIAYLTNRYLNPYIKNFFLNKGVNVNEDEFALSEMIQFIFRAAIRDKKEIYVYIPSKRMRTLLKNWIKEKDQ